MSEPMNRWQRQAYEHPLAGAGWDAGGSPADGRSQIVYEDVPGGRTVGLSVNK